MKEIVNIINFFFTASYYDVIEIIREIMRGLILKTTKHASPCLTYFFEN